LATQTAWAKSSEINSSSPSCSFHLYLKHQAFLCCCLLFLLPRNSFIHFCNLHHLCTGWWQFFSRCSVSTER
jgi:hypothetical protein